MTTLHPLAIREHGTGPVIVLVHAFPLASPMWEPQLAALSANARFVLPDVPGLGATPSAPEGWTVDSLADSIATALDERGITEPIVFGGLSMGGYVAMAFARRHPGRLRGLILANTKAEADTEEGRANRDRMMTFAQDRGAEAVIDSMIGKMVSETTQRDRPQVVAQVRSLAASQPVSGIVAALKALRDRPDATPELPRITVPTLILVGSDDILTPPSAAKTMQTAIPGSKLIEIPTSGHLSNLECPDAFNAALRDFLQSV